MHKPHKRPANFIAPESYSDAWCKENIYWRREWPSMARQYWEDRLLELRQRGLRFEEIVKCIGGNNKHMSERYMELRDCLGLDENVKRKVKLPPVWGLEGKLYYSEKGDESKWRA